MRMQISVYHLDALFRLKHPELSRMRVVFNSETPEQSDATLPSTE